MTIIFTIGQNWISHCISNEIQFSNGLQEGMVELQNGFSGFFDWLVSSNDRSKLVGVEYFPFDLGWLANVRITSPSRVSDDENSLILFLSNSEQPYISLGTQAFYDSGIFESDLREIRLIFTFDSASELRISDDGAIVHGEFE